MKAAARRPVIGRQLFKGTLQGGRAVGTTPPRPAHEGKQLKPGARFDVSRFEAHPIHCVMKGTSGSSRATTPGAWMRPPDTNQLVGSVRDFFAKLFGAQP